VTSLAIMFVATLVIATVYGVLFKEIYPLVRIDTGLALGFALVGLLTYVAIRAIVLGVRSVWSTRD
jgi:hypothetical protein